MKTPLLLKVDDIDESVPGVRSLLLTDARGAALPPFVPGSHIWLDCGGRRNAYSLTNDGLDPHAYQVSVLHVRDGRGGSRWVHDQLTTGHTLAAARPRSAFAPVHRATKHLLIAGGIGVTPILSHLRHARRWNHQVQVIYTYRRGHGAHGDEITDLGGADAELLDDQDTFCSRIPDVLADQPLGTHLYVCGPGPMMNFVLATATELGWPPSRLHSERFGSDVQDPGEPFEVHLTQSRRTVQVPSGTALLDALETVGVKVPNLCRQGVCGECRIPVTAGVIEHRDLFLDHHTKESGTAMMSCVSRAAGPTLEIPL